MESVFEFLFKYRPFVFQEGELTLATPWPLVLLLVMGVVVAVAAFMSYRSPRGDAGPRTRTALSGLRVVALSLVLLALAQPALVLTSTVPEQNFVGVLLDDSKSMRIPGADGAPRHELVDSVFAIPGSPLMQRLEERFAVRTFRFSDIAERLDDLSELTYDGSGTDVGAALLAAQEQLTGVPLAGLVVVSDGATNTGSDFSQVLLPLQSAGVPVFTVGAGDAGSAPDVQIERVELPASVLAGSSMLVNVVVKASGMRGRTVPIQVLDGGSMVATESAELRGEDETTVALVRLEALASGVHELEFRVPPQDGERVAENNSRAMLLEVEDRTEKILYFEGEPRFEVKFLRRAVRDDDNIQVVVLQRTAENKYLRLDVDDSEQLAGGFPKTRKELFAYRGLIIGSVEASYFTHDQLEMIADFVRRRGGGLLMLGGTDSFGEGGYAGTPVADALPVVLEAAQPREDADTLRITATRPGRSHPVTRLQGSQSTFSTWSDLPALITVNDVRSLKPGATALLRGSTGAEGDDRIVLATQRYGRGTGMALPVHDTWTWQMSADIPLEDMTHERFWRQLLRWLVDGVPEPVTATLSAPETDAETPVELRVEVMDEAYLGVENAQVSAAVSGPAGGGSIPLRWNAEESAYTASISPSEPGLHAIEVGVNSVDGSPIGSAQTHLRVADSNREFFDAGMNTSALQRLAEETGGRFYDRGNLDGLPEDIQVAGGGITVTESRDLWDAPVLFLVLVGLVATEWVVRRRKELV
ncbi:MAG: glutamine amidotransferase [Gemmatimonadota bacterium]